MSYPEASGADEPGRSPLAAIRGTGHRDPMGTSGHPNIRRVVVMVQENHTTDNYFAGWRRGA